MRVRDHIPRRLAHGNDQPSLILNRLEQDEQIRHQQPTFDRSCSGAKLAGNGVQHASKHGDVGARGDPGNSVLASILSAFFIICRIERDGRSRQSRRDCRSPHHHSGAADHDGEPLFLLDGFEHHEELSGKILMPFRVRRNPKFSHNSSKDAP